MWENLRHIQENATPCGNERTSMAIGYVLYTPQAGDKNSLESARQLQALLSDRLQYYDMNRVTNYTAFLGGMEQEDYLVLVGGDGTLNRFVNDTAGIPIRQEILYYPTGDGNDFARDLEKANVESPFPVTKYLKNLPSAEVKGKRYRFLNGVGLGIDGYCRQMGDEIRKTKKPNYAAIALRGLLHGFSPGNAVLTVDGREYTYKKVWMATTLYGRYCCGMMPTPQQNRGSPDQTLSVMLLHGAGRLRTLLAFPGLFRGKHGEHTHMVALHTGHEITVTFDRPTALQIDGQSVPGVSTYTAYSPALARNGPVQSGGILNPEDRTYE